jgi:glutathione S-transferase
MLKVYGFSKVNSFARGRTRDLRVLWALEEMQLPYEIVGMDHPACDLSTEAYRRFSPFQQIPAIDDEGLVLSESAAILMYLARKTGRLVPREASEEAQVIRWCLAAISTVEPPLGFSVILEWFKDEQAPKFGEFMGGWVQRVLGNLDRWLAGRTFIATDDFTIADILMAHVLDAFKDDTALRDHRRVVDYRDRCLARPAWKRTLERYCARVEAA